jgi:replication factor A1
LYLPMGEMLLPNLMVGNCHHRICVRVSRFWDFYDPADETNLLHTDMVLIDEEVGKPNFNFTLLG